MDCAKTGQICPVLGCPIPAEIDNMNTGLVAINMLSPVKCPTSSSSISRDDGTQSYELITGPGIPEAIWNSYWKKWILKIKLTYFSVLIDPDSFVIFFRWCLCSPKSSKQNVRTRQNRKRCRPDEKRISSSSVDRPRYDRIHCKERNFRSKFIDYTQRNADLLF